MKKRSTRSLSNSKEAEEKQQVVIHVKRYQALCDILDDFPRLVKMIFSLFFVALFIFLGLAFVTIAVKCMYPYSDIRTNALGATTVQDESTEVTYWLFNTAELWANSGIQVKKNDILTIRASGKSHTAIHHLVKNARDNELLDNKWTRTQGDDQEKEAERDRRRGRYRLFPNRNQDALIMQVVPIDLVGRKEEDSTRIRYLRPDSQGFTKDELKQHKENFYFIGKERTNLHINHDGILHFAVNDIVLNDSIILEMLKESYDLHAVKISDLESFARKYWKEISGKANNLQLGYHILKDTIEANRLINKFGLANDFLSPGDSVNELLYYAAEGYHNVWYDDNIGSFLIVIERKK